MRKYILILFFISIPIQKMVAQDSVKVFIIGFEYKMKYQIFIENYVYEFNHPKYEAAGCLVAKFPKKFFDSKCYYIQIRCKKKCALRWEYCEVPIFYDSTKKYFLLYRDYSTKSSCFIVRFSNDFYAKGFNSLYEEGSEKLFGPDKITKLDQHEQEKP